jgi:hypothetical protein
VRPTALQALPVSDWDRSPTSAVLATPRGGSTGIPVYKVQSRAGGAGLTDRCKGPSSGWLAGRIRGHARRTRALTEVGASAEALCGWVARAELLEELHRVGACSVGKGTHCHIEHILCNLEKFGQREGGGKGGVAGDVEGWDNKCVCCHNPKGAHRTPTPVDTAALRGFCFENEVPKTTAQA